MTDEQYDALAAAFIGRLRDLIAEFKAAGLETEDMIGPLVSEESDLMDEFDAS